MRARLQQYPCDICCTPDVVNWMELVVVSFLAIIAIISTVSVILIGSKLGCVEVACGATAGRSRSMLRLATMDEVELMHVKKTDNVDVAPKSTTLLVN